ncbi:hypothetical protein GOP47_0014469 [Adiantum capillus-veneris]|uniref:Nitrate regulatory gene2 protein n=1 Tax=Adiantum capillus-veneris TaxID=13818 RepID=A0A9D4UMB6_ADICA|nr:hypothetical protein GOP47_0014469 [Adiantum capillus-veneris]
MGCKHSTARNSEVLWRCKKRKRLMSDAVKFRQEFAAAQLAYIQTLKLVGHALSHYSNQQLSSTEVIHAEKKGEAAHSDAPSPALEPSSQPLSKPSPSPSITEPLNPRPPSSSSSPQPAPSSVATLLPSAGSAPVTRNKEAAIPNGVSSPTIQALLRQLSDDVPVSSMPSSPMNGTAYYPFSQPSSPQSSAWDPFSLFSVFPYRSPERALRQISNWDPDIETTTDAGVDGLPDLEEGDTGHKVERNEPKKMNVEQNLGKINIAESLGKAEKKQIEPLVEKMLPKIDEDSAEDAASSTSEDTKPNVVAKPKGKENDKSPWNQINECMKRITVAFENALESGNEVSQILEAQIVYPRARLRDLSDSFGLASTISWQWPRRSTSSRVDLDDSDDEMEHDKLGSHSLTLQRLYTWERKLYKEVKIGEQLHIAFLRKSREFHSIDGRGKDSELVEQCRTDMKSLESQLVVAFGAISSVSLRIQKVTYEELYPQLIELLRRQVLAHAHTLYEEEASLCMKKRDYLLTIMWRAMLECHTIQKEAALEIVTMEKSGNYKISASDAHRSATIELEKQLEAWKQHFYLWVISQQRYIDTLLTWIKICHMEPESNSRKGAASPAWTARKAPIYMLARNWHDSLLCLEENTEVVNAIGKFASAVHDIQVGEWEELVRMKRADMASRSMDLRGRKGNEQDKSGEEEDAVLESLKIHLPSIFDALTSFSLVAYNEYEKLHKEADAGVEK